MRVIGITGGVGAGKSAVLAYIKEKYNDFIIFAGRLGQYRYFDMAPIVEQVLGMEL